MLELRVTQAAQNDIIDIGLYTQAKWGDKQRRSYLTDLDERLQWLREYWELGKRRDDLGDGYYSYPHAKHTIFYRVNDSDLEIIGVLHSRIDYLNHL